MLIYNEQTAKLWCVHMNYKYVHLLLNNLQPRNLRMVNYTFLLINHYRTSSMYLFINYSYIKKKSRLFFYKYMKRNKIYMIRTIKCRNVIAIRVVWVSCLLFWFHFLIRDSHPGRQRDGWLAVCWFFFWFATNKKETRRRNRLFFTFLKNFFFILLHSLEWFFSPRQLFCHRLKSTCSVT